MWRIGRKCTYTEIRSENNSRSKGLNTTQMSPLGLFSCPLHKTERCYLAPSLQLEAGRNITSHCYSGNYIYNVTQMYFLILNLFLIFHFLGIVQFHVIIMLKAWECYTVSMFLMRAVCPLNGLAQRPGRGATQYLRTERITTPYAATTLGILHHIDGWVQERPNSIANTLELSLPCTNPFPWNNHSWGMGMLHCLHVLNEASVPPQWVGPETWQRWHPVPEDRGVSQHLGVCCYYDKDGLVCNAFRRPFQLYFLFCLNLDSISICLFSSGKPEGYGYVDQRKPLQTDNVMTKWSNWWSFVFS